MPLEQELAKSVRDHFKPVLVVMTGNHIGKRVTVNGNVLIGRDPDAELFLDDAGVSWHHAIIEDRGGSWVVVDQGSTNGTAVNTKRVTEQEVQDGDKVIVGRILVRFEVQDAADAAYEAYVEKLLTVDDLSGLYLRRRFDVELNTLLREAAMREEVVGLLVMDLDGIKAINDTYGHAFGAYTIGESGRVIGAIMGGRGIACRWGGDEYLAALPGLSRDEALAVAKEIVAAINQHLYELNDVVLHPGISIGCVAYPLHGRDAAELFEKADAALYKAKARGKNRVCTGESPSRVQKAES